MWLARIDRKIEQLLQRQARQEHGRRAKPRSPEWIVQLGIGLGLPPVQLHRRSCHPAGKRHRPVGRDEARRLLADGTSARTRCLGHAEGGTALEPERTAVHDRTGTRLLLASDGAYEPLDDSGTAIPGLLAGGTVQEAARRLVEAAVEHADPEHTDNSTVLVADFH